MRWVVIFKDTSEMLAVRANQDLRDRHVAFARENPQLLIGGGLRPEADQDFTGALWVIEAETRAAVVDLITADPFYFPDYRQYEIYAWGKILEDQEVTL